MRHMLKENVAITVSRQSEVIGEEEFDAISVSDSVVDFNFYRRGGEMLFPLYLYPPEGSSKAHIDAELFETDDPFGGKERIENFAPKFRMWLDERYSHGFSPEEVMGFMYAVLHAPTYRRRYRNFLRRDFPRIPFPEGRADFEALSALGWDLIQKHLLRGVPALGLGDYRGKGDNAVEKPRYVESEQAVYINAAQHFAPVPQAVWEFHIGGYQVLAKYLKDRKGRALTLDEIKNVENVANVLAHTITAMQQIDEAYNRAFPD